MLDKIRHSDQSFDTIDLNPETPTQPETIINNLRNQLLNYIHSIEDHSIRGTLLELLMLCEKKFGNYGIHIAAGCIHDGVKSGQYPAPKLETTTLDAELPTTRPAADLGSASLRNYIN
jgi:hypothetical protein